MIVAELVSILIPAYNADKWIRQTIESALKQTWDSKEIIIVDDGSEDQTLDIAKTFESRYVKIVSQINSGASSARNRAFALSKGAFIQWLDADDLLAADKISVQMNAANKEKSNLILYSAPHGVFYHRYNKAKFRPDSLWQDLSPVEWLITNCLENLWMNPAAWLVNRAIAEKAGPWNEQLSMDDDGEYFARVVATSERVKFVGESRCYYRQSSFRQVSRAMSEKALGSLFLSATLRIRSLLFLEDSERTRKASLALLETSLPHFYPENLDLLQKIADLAKELGGELTPPKIGLLSGLLQNLCGAKSARKLRRTLRQSRLAAAVKWDEIMYKLGI
jgi:hypothetical protein